MNVFNNVILARNSQLPDDDRMIEICRSICKSINVNNLSVCIGWCADQVILRSARYNDKGDLTSSFNWNNFCYTPQQASTTLKKKQMFWKHFALKNGYRKRKWKHYPKICIFLWRNSVPLRSTDFKSWLKIFKRTLDSWWQDAWSTLGL